MALILVGVTPGGLRACNDCSWVPSSSIAAMIRFKAPVGLYAKGKSDGGSMLLELSVW